MFELNIFVYGSCRRVQRRFLSRHQFANRGARRLLNPKMTFAELSRTFLQKTGSRRYHVGRLKVLLPGLDLIRFGGHLPRGRYGVHNGRNERSTHASPVTDEFKAQAVRLVLDEGRSVTAVARELDLVGSALGNWVRQAQADRTPGRLGLTTSEREELVRLRRALRIVEEEREILKKATAFFAKQSR